MKHSIQSSLLRVITVGALLVSSVAATAATGSYKARVSVDGDAIVDIANYRSIDSGNQANTADYVRWQPDRRERSIETQAQALRDD